MKVLKKLLIIIAAFVFLLSIIITISFINLNNKTKKTMDDYAYIYTEEKYATPHYIDNVEVFKQDVSCGYAVIEMFAKWNNIDYLTENYLYTEYGKVVTSTGKSFEKEMNKQFASYQTTMYKYLTNTDLIDKVYTSLSNGMPVPFEWAAKLDDTWTLHYSLIIGIDIKQDKIIIANPYGYIENISISEFLDRTSFSSYEKMPLFLKLGFAFNVFEKNTIFIITNK